MSRHDMDEAGAGRLQALASSASVVVWHTAADGSVRTANPSWETFTGQTEAQYSGWGWSMAIHPDDRERALNEWRACVAARRELHQSLRLLHRDSSYRHVLAQATPVIVNGQLQEWVGVCVDVTASEEARRALASSEQRLRFLDHLGQSARHLTDAAEVMAVTARLLGEHLGVTRCAYADVEADSNRFTIRNDWTLPGVPSSAGVYSLDLFGPQATSNLRRGLHLVVRDVDRELGDEGGGRMFKAIGIKAIICAGLVKGKQLVAMMAVHSATPRDWTVEEIALVSEVVERSWAHIERVRADAILREQDKRKDEFLATLAHELRNPLAPIKYALALLSRSQDPRLQSDARATIDRQVSQMAHLVDDLLDLSRVSRGKIQLQLEVRPVVELVERAIEVSLPALEAGKHDLRTDVRTTALVDVDPVRIVQVLSNLLGNAAKYTPAPGRISLVVTEAQGTVEIEVSDNGVGIAPEDQPRVFDMFTQLPHTHAMASGGLGIGLSLVRFLSEMHGGSVAVHSEGLGQGTSFKVRLPVALGAAADKVEPHASRASDTGPMLKIAVIEDNDDGRNSLVEMLRLLGHDVQSAADGLAGVALVEDYRPDVVLLDLGLPMLDGVEVCKRIRANSATAQTRVLALTGWGTDADRAKTAQAGFNMHLTKPVDPLLLVKYLAGEAQA